MMERVIVMKKQKKDRDLFSKISITLFVLAVILLIKSVVCGIWQMMNYEEKLAEQDALIDDLKEILDENIR